jgi:hypothetical protein
MPITSDQSQPPAYPGRSLSVNAAVVHMLSTRVRTTAVFLDLQAAFDMVGHQKLDQTLATRGCPISALMFKDVWSLVIVNIAISPPFQRTRGVLQGSPLSPALFNIFIYELLFVLNAVLQTLQTVFSTLRIGSSSPKPFLAYARFKSLCASGRG